MKKLFGLCAFVFISLFAVAGASAQCQGNVYITSLTWQNESTVFGYSATELDYCAGLYYDPAVSATLSEGFVTNSALIGEGYTQGYADSVPARLDFGYSSPINNLSYTTQGTHYVIAYYQVWVPYWGGGYYWYDPWQLGFQGQIGGGYEHYEAPDYYGYFYYVSYWFSSPQFVGNTTDTITYQGQTQCPPGQQLTSTGQPCPGECTNGQQFTSSGELCPNYIPPVEPPPQPIVTVAVGNQPLRPANTTGAINTRAATCITGVPNPGGREITLQLVNDSNNSQLDAGHKEDFHTGPRPLGNLGRTSGITGADGCFITTYFPPVISGKFKIKATISGIPSESDIYVGIMGLAKIPLGENHRLNGGGPEDCNAVDCSEAVITSKYAKPHPSDHWVVPESIPGLVKIGNDYKNTFYQNVSIPPSDMVTYNDASLIWGGKFDLPRKNKTMPDWLDGPASGYPHGEHREGRNIDTRTSNIPDSREETLIQICRNNNFGINDERFGSAPHIHLRWGDLRRTGGAHSSILQNGIDQNTAEFDVVPETPSTFVRRVGEAVFERQITQPEFEAWYSSIANAKSQGLNVFLPEVKTFEKQLFASQEYIARQRTNEEFVQDVFASHLFRDPTDEELSYWMDFLSNIGGNQEIEPTENNGGRRQRNTITLNQTQRRQLFLYSFEALPDFANKIASVVDDAYSEPPH